MWGNGIEIVEAYYWQTLKKRESGGVEISLALDHVTVFIWCLSLNMEYPVELGVNLRCGFMPFRNVC